MDEWSELKTNLTFKRGSVRPFFDALDSAGRIDRGFVSETSVDSEGNLFFEDPFGVWEGHRTFAGILAPYVNEGYLKSVCPHQRQWGYYFDGRGAAFPVRIREEIDFEKPVEMMRERRAQPIPGYLEIGFGQRDSAGVPSPAIQFRFSWEYDHHRCGKHPDRS